MYKVKNKLNQRVKYKDIYFEANETKMLEEKPTSDKFYVEMDEMQEKQKNSKGGKR